MFLIRRTRRRWDLGINIVKSPFNSLTATERMNIIISCVYLLAVCEVTSSVNNVDLTPHEVLSQMNHIHEDFPNAMIKPILRELENRPRLVNKLKNEDLELRAAHGTNSHINLNPVMMNSGNMEISHAANSEFQIKPQKSNGEVSLQSDVGLQNSNSPGQNKIYQLNLHSSASGRKDAETKSIVLDARSRPLQIRGTLATANFNEVYRPNSAPKLQIFSTAEAGDSKDLSPHAILYATAVKQPGVVNYIANAGSQVVNRPLKAPFTLGNRRTLLTSQPVRVNVIANPQRSLMLRRIIHQRPQRIYTLYQRSQLPLVSRLPMPLLRSVNTNSVPIPLTPLIPLNTPRLVPVVPVGMAAPQ